MVQLHESTAVLEHERLVHEQNGNGHHSARPSRDPAADLGNTFGCDFDPSQWIVIVNIHPGGNHQVLRSEVAYKV